MTIMYKLLVTDVCSGSSIQSCTMLILNIGKRACESGQQVIAIRVRVELNP